MGAGGWEVPKSNEWCHYKEISRGRSEEGNTDGGGNWSDVSIGQGLLATTRS